MNDSQMFTVPEGGKEMRVDRFLSKQLPMHSRTRIQDVIRQGLVLRNGLALRPSEILRPGDSVTWQEPDAAPCTTAEPEDIPLDILYEDEELIVLNKPAGMVVHPGAGNRESTLVSALLFHSGSLSKIGGEERPGIVHRLDKETSGCIVVAKSDVSHRELARQFASRGVQKTYIALVEGTPRVKDGIIDAPIARHPVHRKKMAVAAPAKGRDAVTEYHVVSAGTKQSLVECRPKTGRTHQIRVHLKHLGHPVVGDPLYGKRGDYTRHMLHAWKLVFTHPVSGKTLEFEAPIPDGFVAA